MLSRLACCALLALLTVGCSEADPGQGEQDLKSKPPRAWNPDPVREGNLRVATFNIRNFPTARDPAVPDEPPPQSFLLDTDQDLLIATLVKLEFDVMAVEEIRDAAAFDSLVARLASGTGRPYEARLSVNANGNSQLVGLVVDTAKLSILETEEHTAVDVKGTHRPGLSARLASTRNGGVDFSVMVLHLASGDSKKRAALRVQQAAKTAEIVAAEQSSLGDADYLVLGDLNTAREEQEFPALDAAFASGTGLSRQDNELGCTSYWIKNSARPTVTPSWIDQVYVASLDELDRDVPVVSGAHCWERSCQQFDSTDAETGTTYFGVSDHCPVYFELVDESRDP